MPTEATTIPAENTSLAEETNEPPKRVTFDALQQAKVNALIADAQGRAAAGLRADVLRLQAELDKRQTSFSAEDANALEERVTTAKQELAKTRQEISSATTRSALLAACESSHFIEPALAAELLKDQVQFIDGNLRAVNQHGSPRINMQGEQMTLNELVEELANKKSWMILGTVRAGSGSTETLYGQASNQYPLEEYFGQKANSQKHNQLAMTNNKKYRILPVRMRDGREAALLG